MNNATREDRIEFSASEVYSNYTGDSCLPSDDLLIKFTGSSNNDEFIRELEVKTWHFSFALTLLTILATYFTIAELRAVALSFEAREQNGQSETHAKKLSLLTNCLICIWNMCYSVMFFVLALY